jgi:hypothetical protein
VLPLQERLRVHGEPDTDDWRGRGASIDGQHNVAKFATIAGDQVEPDAVAGVTRKVATLLMAEDGVHKAPNRR